MVFVGNINQSVDVLLKTSSLFDPFPPEMGTDTAFLDRMHCYIPGWEIPKFRPDTRMLLGDISLNRCDLPVLRGPNSQRLKLFSTSGSIRARSSHFSRSCRASGSMPMERRRISIHSSFVKALRPCFSSTMSTARTRLKKSCQCCAPKVVTRLSTRSPSV